MNRLAHNSGFRGLLLGMTLAVCASSFAGDASGPVKLPVRPAEEKIRAVVLKHTPLGSSKESVLAFINTRLRHEGEPKILEVGANRRETESADAARVGASAIDELEVGHYGELTYLLLIKTYVYVSWAFDANGRLIDVIVYKEMDGM